MRANRLYAFLWLFLTASFPAFGDPILIEGVTVVSPEREAPLRDAFVLLDEGRIRSVSAARPPVGGEILSLFGDPLPCLGRQIHRGDGSDLQPVSGPASPHRPASHKLSFSIQLHSAF